ncbi:MAG: glycogen synthase GlgA [Bryobacteraceae bacterium]
MARILMVASEAAPFVKTGGLADVLGSLPKALIQAGEEVAVVLPLYKKAVVRNASVVYENMRISVGAHSFRAHILEQIESGVRYLFVQIPELYDRDSIYDEWGREYADNHIRFAALCQAALGVVRDLFKPDIVHGHDWQAGLLPVLLRDVYAGHPAYVGIKTVFTIHNLGYQGRYWRGAWNDLGLPERLFRPDLLEYYGELNLLKAGLVFSHYLTTVSKTYAREIQTPEFGFGLDGLLRARRDSLFGIVNGVDYDHWDPATDPKIPKQYDVMHPEGKLECKQTLLEESGLPSRLETRPVIGIVSRFAAQKGFDLIAQVAHELAAEDLGFVVLGSGDHDTENFFRWYASTYPEKIATRIGYDDGLAHRIEAGCDLFLMPSRYEPCGLNQIYSLRYGTLPVVRATGGLEDTVDDDTGFKFWGFAGHELLWCVRFALSVYGTPRWERMTEAAMLRDFSWGKSAKEYIELYRRLMTVA